MDIISYKATKQKNVPAFIQTPNNEEILLDRLGISYIWDCSLKNRIAAIIASFAGIFALFSIRMSY